MQWLLFINPSESETGEWYALLLDSEGDLHRELEIRDLKHAYFAYGVSHLVEVLMDEEQRIEECFYKADKCGAD